MKKRMHGWDVASMEAGVPPKQWKNLMSEETKALEAERAKVAALTAERNEYRGIVGAVCDHVSRSPWTIAGQTLVEGIQAIEAHSAALTAERDELKAWQVAQREWEAVASKVILDVTRLAHDNDALTKALQALVESMPECWGCEELATHWRTGSYENEEACSKHSGGGKEMTRAPAIRAAVALLAKQREAG